VSAAANAKVVAGWAPLFDIAVPQQLWGAMEAQRGACEAVVASKDALVAGGCGAERRWAWGVLAAAGGWASALATWRTPKKRPFSTLAAELRGALRSKDEEYVRLLKRQAGEIDTLLVRAPRGGGGAQSNVAAAGLCSKGGRRVPQLVAR
jgi:hypothetical protein